MAQLRHPELDVTIDLHRRVAHNTHNRLSFARAQTRITARGVGCGDGPPWGATRIRVIDPRDAVVVGLAVNRAWGSDAWRLKPRDYVDFSRVGGEGMVSPETVLAARASELGVPRTFGLFLDRCDPFRERLRLAPPTWWSVRATTYGWHRNGDGRTSNEAVMGSLELAHDGLELARALPVVRRLRRNGVDLDVDAGPGRCQTWSRAARRLGSAGLARPASSGASQLALVGGRGGAVAVSSRRGPRTPC